MVSKSQVLFQILDNTTFPFVSLLIENSKKEGDKPISSTCFSLKMKYQEVTRGSYSLASAAFCLHILPVSVGQLGLAAPLTPPLAIQFGARFTPRDPTAVLHVFFCPLRPMLIGMGRKALKYLAAESQMNGLRFQSRPLPESSLEVQCIFSKQKCIVYPNFK